MLPNVKNTLTYYFLPVEVSDFDLTGKILKWEEACDIFMILDEISLKKVNVHNYVSRILLTFPKKKII